MIMTYQTDFMSRILIILLLLKILKKLKKKIKGIEEFKHKKMHIDGILEIQNIGDYSIKLEYLPKKQEQVNNQYSYDDIKKI